KILCGIAAFKQHCAFGFWKGRELGYVESREGEAMGQFGRITTLKDLPPKKELLALIKRAMQDSEIRAAQRRAVVARQTARPAPEKRDAYAAVRKKEKRA